MTDQINANGKAFNDNKYAFIGTAIFFLVLLAAVL